MIGDRISDGILSRPGKGCTEGGGEEEANTYAPSPPVQHGTGQLYPSSMPQDWRALEVHIRYGDEMSLSAATGIPRMARSLLIHSVDSKLQRKRIPLCMTILVAGL